MRNYHWMFLLMLLLLPFCSSRSKDGVVISSAEVSSAVEADILQAAVLRKLQALEEDTATVKKRADWAPRRTIEAQSSIEPMYLRYKPPE